MKPRAAAVCSVAALLGGVASRATFAQEFVAPPEKPPKVEYATPQINGGLHAVKARAMLERAERGLGPPVTEAAKEDGSGNLYIQGRVTGSVLVLPPSVAPRKRP